MAAGKEHEWGWVNLAVIRQVKGDMPGAQKALVLGQVGRQSYGCPALLGGAECPASLAQLLAKGGA
jgi:hypothetical protein